jgi:hypothetical protein
LGISDKEFLARVNSDLESFQTVDGVKHRSGSGPTTVLKNFTGEGTTTPREMTAIMSDAAKRFRNVFMNDYGNKFRPEVFNGQFAFNKPGHLETGEAGAKTPMNNVVGVLTNGATIAVSSEKPSTMDADIRRGIKLAISAAKGEHITQGDSVAMRSEDSAGPASHGNGQSIALDGSSLSVFDAGRAQLALPKTTSPNTDCAKTVRRIFDAGNVHIRGKNGETLSTAAAYAPALQCDPRFTKIGGGNGASFTVERARQMAQATLGKCDIPIVVVMINERSQQPLAKDGHIFYVNADDKPYSGFRNRDGKTGMSDPGNFKYVAFAYTGPVKDYTPNMQLADVTETQTKALAHQHLNQRHHHVRPPQAPA